MKNKILPLFLLFLLAGNDALYSQAFQGYTLFSPNNSRNTYLTDMNNQVIHSWTHTKSGGYSCYLLPDGTLLRSAVSSNSQLNGGGATGIIQKYSWAGVLLWEYTYSSSSYRLHHDFEPLPNGNVLMIAWEVKSSAQTVAAGLNHSATLWPDHIIEVQPAGTTGGNIVWKWHFWDHLIQDYDAAKLNYGVVANHPELLDINAGSTSGDWMHVNGISYDPLRDEIIFSSHNLDELFVIDHSTTTEQAAGHTGGNRGKGGDILYRWGRPSNYRAAGNQVFNVVHNTNVITGTLPGAGNFLSFNNREGTNASQIVEITPPRDTAGNYIWVPGTQYAPVNPAWSYMASGFYSNHLGGVQRLPNGNTFIVESTSGYIFETDQNGNTVWSYNRGGEIARAYRYPPDYAGLVGLPVEFTSFTAKAAEGDVELNWSTSSEKNNMAFEVCKSTDDSRFDSIAAITGHGTTTERNNYTFTDKAVKPGHYFYKIKQIDFDGTHKFSETVEVEVLGPDVVKLYQNYPNPFNPSTKISFFVPNKNNINLSVFDIRGNLISTLFSGEIEAGEHLADFKAFNLPSGIYFYRITAPGYQETKSMMLLK